MKLFSSLSKTSRVMLMAVGVICLIMLVLGLLIINLIYPFEKPLPFTVGIATGCIHSIIKVALLEQSIGRVIDMEKERASAFARLQAIGRYFLTIIVFVLAIIFSDIFGLFGVILGVLSLQFAAYVTHIVIKKQ